MQITGLGLLCITLPALVFSAVLVLGQWWGSGWGQGSTLYTYHAVGDAPEHLAHHCCLGWVWDEAAALALPAVEVCRVAAWKEEEAGIF